MLSLITGGAGFLGSHLADRLVRRREAVLIIDNLSSGTVANLESISTGRATFVFGDCTAGVQALRSYISDAHAAKIDRIFHLASPASPEAYAAHPWETLAVNGTGTMDLIEIALEHRARFVFASTSEIYGDPLVHPQQESYFGNVDPIGPRSCYDEGKRFGEAAVAVAVRTRGLDGRIVRFFNCYGPRMKLKDGRLIPAFLEASAEKRPLPIHGSGKQTRSMTYVDDAIELLLLIADSKQTTLQPVNVGNDDERTVEEIAHAFAKVVGIDPDFTYLPARPSDPQQRRPDLHVARSLGWKPATSLERGLSRTYAWFTSDPSAYVRSA